VNLRIVPFSIALAIAVSAAGQPILTPAPTSLSFTWVTGGVLPAAQSISVKGTTAGAAFTTAILPGGTQWMTITPSAGNLPAAMSVLVNPSEMPVGVYPAFIQVSAVGFTSPLLIPVTLTVNPAPPTLILSTNALSFTTPPNPPATQTLTLTTSGGPVPFSIPAQSSTWLTVTPISGVVLPGFPVTLTVAVTNTGLNPASAAYAGKITIVATGVPSANVTQTVAVSMIVNALTPTITNLYPSAALVGSTALTVTISGTGFYKGGTTASAGATPLQTTFVNPTTISAVLPPAILATPGTINITMVNPAPGGISMPAVFTVSATPVIQAIVSAASYAGGAVSPGEFITMFGTGIGPAVPAEMSVVAGYATNTLQSTSVTIDGQNAPMIYVSANQITVQVPYNVTIGLAKVVAVNNNGAIAMSTVDTTATAPGLFLISGVVGQCAALRYSMATGTYSVNGTTSAALVGDIVVFYLTGEGIYDLTASPATGYIVPGSLNPLPQLSPLPAVTIGGAPATVQYAGPMVGGLLGLLQINAVVPAGATKGPLVPVAITIGAGATQAGATIVVK
jgi:uncharacterized protein (TIGR03437 family)